MAPSRLARSADQGAIDGRPLSVPIRRKRPNGRTRAGLEDADCLRVGRLTGRRRGYSLKNGATGQVWRCVGLISNNPSIKPDLTRPTLILGNILMWEKLTSDDITRVKHQLNLTRAATLSRHAAELKSLDAEQGGIEELERLITAFAEKYSTFATSSLPVARSEEQSTEVRKVEAELILVSDAATGGKPAASDVPRDIPSSDLHVQQHVSPNFGIPLRRFVGR